LDRAAQSSINECRSSGAALGYGAGSSGMISSWLAQSQSGGGPPPSKYAGGRRSPLWTAPPIRQSTEYSRAVAALRLILPPTCLAVSHPRNKAPPLLRHLL